MCLEGFSEVWCFHRLVLMLSECFDHGTVKIDGSLEVYGGFVCLRRSE